MMNLKPLIEILIQEQKVHERLLQAKRNERKMLAIADASNLLKNTALVSDLVDQARSLETRRITLTKQIAQEMGIESPNITLPDLLAVLPPANRIDLEQARNSLKTTLEAIRGTNRSNSIILKRSVEGIREDLKQFMTDKESGVYNSRGTKERSAAPRVGLNVRA